ncbi:DUF2867 domain-containing protein [Nocardia sp. NPDC020380]|uniref:DUF2867 domain-containing protein n=1 Tax=Nocardia sp. NPDC020380 TaxID=3364309 RepID=UPI0037940F37
MKLPATDFTNRPWRIHDLTPDFTVEDVWTFRTPGAGPHDFPAMLTALETDGGLNRNPPLVQFLFAVRWKLGALLGWDGPGQGIGTRIPSLRDRLPPNLRETPIERTFPNTPFTLVYELDDECAIELANQTVHAIAHLGWVPSPTGEYELHMTALVKPNGLCGQLYMAGIKPFRYLIVYPALTRQWEAAWHNRNRETQRQ